MTGNGPHTVEVRSIDAAGNVEAKQVVDFEIGASAPRHRLGIRPAGVGRDGRDVPARGAAAPDDREALREARAVRPDPLHGRDERRGDAAGLERRRRAS